MSRRSSSRHRHAHNSQKPPQQAESFDPGRIPVDPEAYKQAYEYNLYLAFLEQEKRGLKIRCHIHGQQEFAFSDGKCTLQDAVHPEGIMLVPAVIPTMQGGRADIAYFLCAGNFRLLETKRLRKVENLLQTTCLKCLHTEIVRLDRINPALFQDLRPEEVKKQQGQAQAEKEAWEEHTRVRREAFKDRLRRG